MAIYETFARMSQPWINNVPEVDWHGNNGSQLTGPECASSRYTEARLSKLAEEGMFANINKNTVNMILNFSEDEEWPEVLPAIFPRLVVNGCQGIGSTIANTWLPNNLREISKSIIQYIDTGSIDCSELFPDFPSGGIIINKEELSEIYKTGKGKVILRGKVEIEDNVIKILELPYQVYAQPYVESLTDLVLKGEITGVEDVNNCSGKNKLLIEVECSGSPLVVLNQLYKKTDLQRSYNANQWALVGKTPRLLNFSEYCKIYKEHNLSCVQRELQFDLDKALKRINVVNGLLIALANIDEIIKLIKKSKDTNEAKRGLVKAYSLNKEQAEAILAMKLSNLAHLEVVNLQKEHDELDLKIHKLQEFLQSETKQLKLIKDRLKNIANKFGSDRKTMVKQINENKSTEEKIIEEVEPEKCVVVMTESGYIKRIPVDAIKIQKRNGKGIKNQDDITLDVIKTNTIDSLMVFTDKGKVYKLLVNDIPEGTNSTRGKYIKSLIEMEPDEKVRVIYSIRYGTESKYAVFATKNGIVKKTALEEYIKTKKKTGISALNIKEGDKLVSVTLTSKEDIMLLTKDGMSIRFSNEDVSATGRASIGLKGINLNEGDEVVTCLPIKNESDDLALFTEDGLAKRIPLSEFTVQKRGGKGVLTYPRKKKAIIVAATLVNSNDYVLVCGNNNSICISASELPTSSRTALGVITLKDGKVVTVSKV